MAVTIKDIDFGSSTPSARPEQRIFRERGDQRYSLEVLPIGLTFWVDRLRRERHELIGELLVMAKPGTANVLTIGENGTISAGDMNFSSVQARSTRAKLLASRAELSGVDWHGLLEEFCLRTIQAERMGKPAVVLAEVDIDATEAESSGEWDIDGFPLLKTLPTLLFADSESGKSYFAMWLVGRLAQMGENILYCDWEFDPREHRRRLARLFQPMPKNLFYAHCDTPFPQQVDRLSKLLRQHKCSYIVIDSVGFAAEGPAEAQETAAKHFKALRMLGVGSLNIAHTPKGTEEGRDATVFGCYSSETEVLTTEGWKRHGSVTLDDTVMCFNPATNGMEWHRPSVVHSYAYSGEMVRLKTSTTEALVTPNHRCVVRRPEAHPLKAHRRYHPEWEFIEAKSLGRLVQVPLAAPPSSPRQDLHVDGGDDFLRLIGWWIAEGSIGEKQRKFCLAQAWDSPLAARMRETLTRLNIPHTCTRSVNRKRPHELPMMYVTTKITDSNVALSRWLASECGRGAPNKRLPSLAWELSPRQQAVLLEALVDGDGTRCAYGGYLYHTVSVRLADDVQRLCIEMGRPASVRWAPPGEPHHRQRYTVRIGRLARTGLSLYRGRHYSTELYEGTVHCLTVPTGAYVTRLSGKMAIYGNSTFWKAGARSIWFIDKAQVNPKGELRFGLHHRKNNVGERLAPRGYRLVWDKQRTRVEKIDIRSVEELTAGLPILERIKKVLAKGPAHPKYLAEELSVPIGSIRSTLSRHKSLFVKLGSKMALSVDGREDEAPPAPAATPADTEMF